MVGEKARPTTPPHSFHTRQKMGHLHTLLIVRQKNHHSFKNTNVKFTFKSNNTIAQLAKPHTTTILSPTPHDTSGICSLKCNTCEQEYVGQTDRPQTTIPGTHTVHKKDPQSAYAQHILHNRHEYGPIDKTMTLLKPLSKTSLLTP